MSLSLSLFQLMFKCADGKVEEVEELIQQFGPKTVLDARDEDGRSCLYKCCKGGTKNVNLTRLLLQNGADPMDCVCEDETERMMMYISFMGSGPEGDDVL